MKLWPDEVCYETQAGVLQDLQEFGEPSRTTVEDRFFRGVISFKLHLLLSYPNIFIMGEIKHLLMLWHLG